MRGGGLYRHWWLSPVHVLERGQASRRLSGPFSSGPESGRTFHSFPIRLTDVIPTSPATPVPSEPPRPDAACSTDPVRLRGSAHALLSPLSLALTAP